MSANMNFIIRKATQSDVGQIHGLGTSTKEFTVGVREGFWTKEQLSNRSNSEKDLMLVAVDEDGGVVGFSLYAAHIPTGKVTWENLFVKKEYGGQGISKRLVVEGLKKLKEMGYNYVALQNHNANQEKFASYLEKFGFMRGDVVMWMDRFLNQEVNGKNS